MGFIIPSETHAQLSVETRSESFKIHREGLPYGEHGEQHIELPLEDVPHLIALLEYLSDTRKEEIVSGQIHIITPEAARETAAVDEVKAYWEQLGLSPEICGACGAHLKDTGHGRLICLNACHLGFAGQARFQQFMENFMSRRSEHE